MGTTESFELPSLQKLQSAEQLDLLDVVDTLRARGLSDLVALPQLIVCGDQSSGKSSVLEARYQEFHSPGRRLYARDSPRRSSFAELLRPKSRSQFILEMIDQH